MQKLFTLFCLLLTFAASAQTLSPAELKQFKLREDSLKKFGYEIVRGKDAAVRFRSDSNFTRILVRAIIQDKSFLFPFDSLRTISKIYSPDSSFRIFTWQVVHDDDYCRQKGFIQFRNPRGKEKFIPLRDANQFISNPTDTIADNMWWIGAVYYRILEKEHNGRKYYTLFGYDENDSRTTKKWLDVMWFDDNGVPMFGKPSAFSFDNDSIPKPAINRFLMEYKKDARARVQYDEELDMIIYDHLISESNEPNKKYTYIPDGDYEGFKWQDGRWVHVDKVFNFKLKDGEAPVVAPIAEDKLGNPAKQNEGNKNSGKPKGRGSR